MLQAPYGLSNIYELDLIPKESHAWEWTPTLRVEYLQDLDVNTWDLDTGNLRWGSLMWPNLSVYAVPKLGIRKNPQQVSPAKCERNICQQ